MPARSNCVANNIVTVAAHTFDFKNAPHSAQESYTGHTVSLVMVDVASRMTFHVSLPTKGHILTGYKIVERAQFEAHGWHIKIAITDNEILMIQKNMRDYCIEKSTKLYTTATFTHKELLAERFIQTLEGSLLPGTQGTYTLPNLPQAEEVSAEHSSCRGYRCSNPTAAADGWQVKVPAIMMILK